MANRPSSHPSSGTERRGGGLRPMPDLLGRLLDPAARQRGLTEARLLTAWGTIVGPELAGRCQPVRLAIPRAAARSTVPGTLHVHVAGASALELQHSEPQIVERINDFFGYPAVGRLRLVQAPLPKRPGPPAAPRPPAASPADEAELEQLLSPVVDPDLQNALRGLGRAIQRRSAAATRSPSAPARATR